MRFMKTAIVLLVFLAAAPLFAGQNVYILAHKSVPVDTIGQAELSAIFLGKKRSWENLDAVEAAYVVSRDGDPDLFFKAYLGMPLKKFQRYWLKKVFSGYGVAPKIFKSTDRLVSYIGNTRGSIAFSHELPADMTNIKVLTVVDEAE